MLHITRCPICQAVLPHTISRIWGQRWTLALPLLRSSQARASVKLSPYFECAGPMSTNSFQQRVFEWLSACFPSQVCRDRNERAHRFLEEALELAQAGGCSQHDAHQLLEYVYSRPAGSVDAEVGGVMVTLAGLCAASGLDMVEAADRELVRNWTRIDAIRRKQAFKPTGSPLPQ